MSRFTHRYPLNIAGKYYIDDQCTDCDLCRGAAPQNIRRDDRTGISYVFKQPTTAEEVAAVEVGVKGCPTDAVGDDGDQSDWDTTPIYDWNALYQKYPDIRFDIRAPLLREDAPRTRRWAWNSGIYLLSIILAGIVVNLLFETPNVTGGGAGMMVVMIFLAIIFRATIVFFWDRWQKKPK